jgi:hypothetical protein
VSAPEQLIRRRLGHGSSDITRRVYVHVLEESDKVVTHALGEVVWKPALTSHPATTRVSS